MELAFNGGGTMPLQDIIDLVLNLYSQDPMGGLSDPFTGVA